MLEEIRKLIELAETDYQIRELDTKCRVVPKRIKELEAQWERAKQEFDENAERIAACERDKKQHEQDVEAIRAGLGKSQSKQARVKTDREYWAQMKETDDLKKQLKEAEDKILALMEQSEVLEKQRVPLDQTVREAQERRDTETAHLSKEMNGVSEQLEKLRQERAELVERIPRELRHRYEMVAQARGIAIAGVREGICTGCNMSLTPQQYNELIRNDRLITCETCHRILYWMDHEELKDLVPHRRAQAFNG